MRRLLALVALLAAGACAGLPTSGPIQQVGPDEPRVDAVVRYAPAPPVPGAEPQEVVRGFLDAMLAYPVSTATASAYLTPDAADAWQSSAGVRIYRAPEVGPPSVPAVTVDDGRPVAVEVEVREDAVLDETGHYRGTDRDVTETFVLEPVDGEWRIANPPVGRMVTAAYFASYFRVFDSFFFDARGAQLVADPVHVAVGEQLATGLMASLTAGPPTALAGELRTYLPDPEAWQPSVTVDAEGVAEVEFDVDGSSLDAGIRNRWSAQVVRTLAQVPEVEGVRIITATGPLAVGGGSVQDLGAWLRFDPPEPRGRPGAVVDGRVVRLVDDAAEPVPGPRGDDAGGATVVAVSEDAIAVSAGGDIGVAFAGDPEVVVPAEDVVSLVWDPTGVLWVADRPGGALRIRLVTAEAVRDVQVAPLGTVTSFALDPGARRYAVTTAGESPQVLVGLVQRDQRSGVTGIGPGRVVAPDAAAPAAVVWTGASSLAFLADSSAGRQVFTSRIDGSPAVGGAFGAVPRLPDVGARRLAIDVGSAPSWYVTDDRDRLWHLRAGGSWRLLGLLDVTALGSGR
ncbi:putative lipoprotein LpqB [Aeromicrobium marinum DSM 15272]|uniref:Lipoprotein LpqB n=1 Tax=Aeromicrobium marinum DSM 15272 TaxID=585531 RepID=E2SDU9_9ACTN|nr:LpqB family beta-propeller domain-containing protein [Aeromicrobium marinum]EFQ82676.1 putative lipoprotein LpqB [Aeromicrobium marinum DSM 15272]